MVTVDSGIVTLGVVIVLPIVLRRLTAWYQAPQRSASATATATPKPRLALPALQAPSDWIIAVAVAALVVHALLSAWHVPRDLFYATRQETNASTATLRAQVAGKQLKDIAWHAAWGEEGLERILRRVSSWDGRKLYLLLGADSLLACSYCNSPKDFTNYAIITRTPWYAAHLALVGLLTLPSATFSAMDAILSQLLGLPLQSNQQRIDARDRHHWRRPACWALLAMILAEITALTSWANIDGTGGWKEHWSMNLYVARHLLGAVIVLVIYLFPRTAPVAPITQIGASLRSIVSNIEGTLGLVQSAHVSRYAVERDSGLREVKAQYWSDHANSQEVAPHTQGVASQTLDEHRSAAKLAARNIWLEAETSMLQQEASN